MATEKRSPEDLQEAVAATLRRLRGELGTPGQPATPRRDPATGPVLAGSGAPFVPAQPAASPSPVQPDLLSRAEAEHEIPPNPSARLAELREALAKPDPIDRPRPRLLPYMLSILALAVFAGIGWWAYKSINAAPPNGEVPVVAASQTPEKVPPPADQAAATSNTSGDKTVYDEVAPGSAPEPKTEVLLPPPETPQLPATTGTTQPSTTAAATGSTTAGASNNQSSASTAGTTASGTTASTAPSTPSTTGSTTTASAAATTTGTTAEAPVTSPTTTATTTGSSGMTETLIPGASTSSGNGASTAPAATESAATVAPATTGSSAGATGQSTVAPSTATAPLPAEPLSVQSTPPATTTSANNANGSAAASTAATAPTAPAATAPASPTTTQSASLGNYRIQLASLKSEAAAKKTWKRLESKYSNVLASLTVHIEKVTLTSGTYYRLQAGPFEDKTSAAAACTKLKTHGQPCLVKP